jgi:hypothetical protein
MNMATDRVVNFSDITQKRELLSKLGALRGRQRVRITKFQSHRTLAQNSFWWAAIITPLRDWLIEQTGDVTITLEQTAVILKLEINWVKEVISPVTGEVQRIPKDTHNLGVSDFSELIELAGNWEAKFCDIVIADVANYIEPPAQAKPKRLVEAKEAQHVC